MQKFFSYRIKNARKESCYGERNVTVRKCEAEPDNSIQPIGNEERPTAAEFIRKVCNTRGADHGSDHENGTDEFGIEIFVAY